MFVYCLGFGIRVYDWCCFGVFGLVFGCLTLWLNFGVGLWVNLDLFGGWLFSCLFEEYVVWAGIRCACFFGFWIFF